MFLEWGLGKNSNALRLNRLEDWVSPHLGNNRQAPSVEAKLGCGSAVTCGCCFIFHSLGLPIGQQFEQNNAVNLRGGAGVRATGRPVELSVEEVPFALPQLEGVDESRL